MSRQPKPRSHHKPQAGACAVGRRLHMSRSLADPLIEEDSTLDMLRLNSFAGLVLRSSIPHTAGVSPAEKPPVQGS